MKIRFLDRALISAASVAFFFITALEGLLNYIFVSFLGIGGVLFLKVLLYLLAVIYILLLSKNWITYSLPFLLSFFIPSLIVSIFLRTPYEIFQSIYLILPIALGMLQFFAEPRLWRNFYINSFLISITFLGLILDARFDLPWSGYLFERFGLTMSASREWMQYGVERLAGFSAISWSAASVLAVSFILLMDNTDRIFLKNVQVFFLAIFVCIGLFLTTTKGIIFSIFIAFIASKFILRWPKIILLLLAFHLLIPISVWIFNFNLSFAFPEFFGMSSINLRPQVWEYSIYLLSQNDSFFWGLGLGASGAASHSTSYGLMNSSDSLFFHILSISGIFGIIYTYALLFYISLFRIHLFTKGQVIFIVFFLLYSIIVTGLEQGVVGYFLGYCILGPAFVVRQRIIKEGLKNPPLLA